MKLCEIDLEFIRSKHAEINIKIKVVIEKSEGCLQFLISLCLCKAALMDLIYSLFKTREKFFVLIHILGLKVIFSSKNHVCSRLFVLTESAIFYRGFIQWLFILNSVVSKPFNASLFLENPYDRFCVLVIYLSNYCSIVNAQIILKH